MKVIETGRLKRENIKNIKAIEQRAGATINDFYLIKIDLENGRIAEIISHLNYSKDIIIVSIREIGILTKKVFMQEILYIYEGNYGLEIVSDDFIETKETLDIYKKYKTIIDKLAIEIFK